MRHYVMFQELNKVFNSFLLGALLSGCIHVSTTAQIELTATEDVQCGEDIQKDVDANIPFENILVDPVVDADCIQAVKDTGKAIVDIVTDIATQSPNTVAGKQAIARKATKK